MAAELTIESVENMTRAVDKMSTAFRGLKSSIGTIKGTNALKELQAVVAGVNSMEAAINKMATDMSKSLDVVIGLFQALPSTIGDALYDARGYVGRIGNKVGQQAGESIAAGIDKSSSTVRSSIKKLQTEYEALAKLGQIKIPVLQEARSSGVSLYPGDRLRLKQFEETQRTLNAMLASTLKGDTEVQKALRVMEERSRDLAAAEAQRMNASLSAGKQIVGTIQRNVREEVAAREDARKQLEKQLNADRVFQAAEEKVRKSAAADRLAQVAAAARPQLVSAMRGATADYSVYAPSSKDHASLVQYTSALAETRKELTKFPTQAKAASDGLQRLGIDANTTHSAMRGLASGFGLLWLTWGNLAPLLTGAAISNGFVQTIKLGTQAQQTLETLRVLGGETVASVAALESQLISLSRTGPFGLNEIATAMKTLTLAGLNAAQVGASIKDVLNFAVGGDTSIEKAADVLTSAATAFGYSAEQYNIVGDVIAKAAAISKASVDDMGEAFKTASVLNKQYGASLQDVGLGLSLLSNLGIKGSAAGTALRNMYVDLSGRTKEVAKTLKLLNIDVTDGNGKFVDFVSVVERVQKGLDNLANDSERARARLALFSERGSKPIIEALDQLNAKAKESGKSFTTELQRMRYELENAAGFQTAAAVELSVTAANQMKGVWSTLQASAYEAFKNIEPFIFVITKDLKNAFESEGFKTGLGNLIKGVTTLTAALAENLNTIIALGAAYASFKTAQFAAGVFGTLATSLSAVSTTSVLAAAGFGGIAAQLGKSTPMLTGAQQQIAKIGSGVASLAGVAGSFAAFMAGPWGIAIAAVVAGLTAMYFWMDKTEKAIPSTAKLDALADAYKKEADAIWDKVEALRANISLEEYQRRQQGADAEAAAARAEAATRAEIERLEKASSVVGGRGNSAALAAKARLADAKAQLTVDQDNLKLARERVEQEKARVIAGNAVQQTLVAQNRAIEQAKRNADSAKGPLSLDALDTAKVATDNILSSIKDTYSKLLEVARSESERSIRMLEDKHKNGLINEGEYQAQLLNLTKQGEINRLGVLDDYAQKAEAAYETLRKKAMGSQTGEQLKQTLQNLAQGREATNTGIGAQRAEIQAQAVERLARAANEAAGSMKKLDDESKAFWAAQAVKAEGKDRVTELAKQLTSVKDAQEAFVKGYNSSFGVYEKQIESLTGKLLKATEVVEALQAAIAAQPMATPSAANDWMGGTVDPEMSQRLEAAQAVVARLREEISKLNTEGGKLATNSGLQAILDKDISASLGDGVARGFDAASSALAGFVNNLAKLGKIQEEIAAKEAANIAKNKDDFVKFSEEKVKYTTEGERLQINAFGNMASAAKNFFAQGSKGYKALEAAERTFRAFEMAMSLKSMVFQLANDAKVLAAKLFGFNTVAAAATSGAATEAAAAQTVNTAKAAGGVINQAGGDPYSAFGRMAAMAAIMAALGYATGSFGGGGTPPKQASNEGTGTVLGDTAAKSESITKAIEKLSDNSDIGLQYSQGMLRALNSIEANIGGLASLIVRGTTLADSGVQTGTTVSGINALLDSGAGILTLLQKLPGVANILKGLFGTKVSVTGQGLNLNPTNLQQAALGNLNLQNYVDTYTTKKFLGIKYSSKSGTSFSEADPALEAQFSKIFASFYDAIKLAAVPLGKNLDTVTSALNGFVVNIGKIDLQGLTGTEIQEKLTAIFGAAADSIAQAAIPGLDAFQKVGEGYFETVIRVANAVESATATLNQLGIAVVNYTSLSNKSGDVELEIIRASILAFETAANGVSTGVGKIIGSFSGTADELTQVYKALMTLRDGLAGAGKNIRDLSAEMIQAAGGAESLQDGLSAYFDNFLTSAEKAAVLTQQLGTQFGKIGLSMPNGVEGFKELVKSIDTSTVAGQILFGQVIALAGSFYDLQEVLKDTASTVDKIAEQRADLEKQLADAQAAYNQATMTSAQLLALQREEIYESNRALFDQIQALKAATAAATERTQLQSQLDDLTLSSAELLEKQRNALAESNRALFDQIQAAKAAKAAADERKSIQDQLDELTLSSVELLNKQRDALYESNRALFDQLEAAKVAKAIADERAALQERLDQATLTEIQLREKERNALYEQNRALYDQVIAAEAAKKAAEEAAQAAEQLANAWQSAADSIVDEIKRIRGLLDTPESNFASAQTAFAIATAKARSGDTEAAAELGNLSKSLLDAYEKQATSQQDLARVQGQTLASLQATLDYIAQQPGVTIPAYANGGVFGGGLRLVGERGPELEVTGPSRIYNADQTARMMQGDESLAQELADLKLLMRQMIADNRAAMGAIASNTGKVATILRDVTPNRDSIQTTVVTPP